MHLRTALTGIAVMSLVGLCAAQAPSGSPQDDRAFTFHLETPPVETLPQADGFDEVRVHGFRTHRGAVGSPDVPTRTVLVAIPPGATPRLSVRSTGTSGFRAVLPRPVPRRVSTPAAGDLERPGLRSLARGVRDPVERRVYEPSRSQYEGEGMLPSRLAWLGRIGVLRDQRYVELHLAPVRFDRGHGGLTVESGLEVTVHFDGVFDSAPAPVTDDRFEPVYRSAFENYSQGRQFRLSAVDHRDGPVPQATRAASSSTGPIRRIRVRENGPVRLDYALFAAHAPEFVGTDPTTWRLSNRGEQVPLQIHQEAGDDAVFELGEWVQFYGQALDDEPETILNFENPSNPYDDLYEMRDFTDENAYFLTIETAAQPIMPEREAAAPPGAGEPHFTATARVEVDDFFLPVPGEAWFWFPFTTESSGARTEIVPLPGLASATLQAQFRIRLRGFLDCAGIDPDHETVVSLQNDLLETLVLPSDNQDNVGNQNVGQHDGNDLFVHDFGWVHAGVDPVLTDPVRVILDASDIPGTCPVDPFGNLLNENLLDSIEVDYQRSFVAQNDALAFDYPDGDAIFEVEGLTSSAVEVYEVTNHIGTSGVVDAVRLTGVGVTPDGLTYTVRFRMDNDPGLADGTPRTFVVAGQGAIAVPPAADFEADRVSTLTSDPSQADLVVIAHPDLLVSECSEGGGPCSYDVDCEASETDRCELTLGSELDLLLARRLTQGITSRVARIQDVEDEFNFGLSGPDGIVNFLAWVLSGGWNGPPPAYVLLLGDGSFDYKGGLPSGNYVPTRMMVKQSEILGHYASDNLLGAVAGDDYLADMVMGRLTARTLSEADDVLAKINNYEGTPPGGAWRSQSLFISDRGHHYDVDEACAFEEMNDLADSFLDGVAYTSTKLRYWTENCCGSTAPECATVCSPACDSETMKQDIKDRVNSIVGDGAVLAQFTGHGNSNLWSDDVFFCANEDYYACDYDDTADLTNFAKLPFLIVHNCLTGAFHGLEFKSFGEQWLKRPGGGAIAVYAPSGLGFRFIGNAVITVMWKDLFGPHKERTLGTPVIDSQIQLCTQGSIEACQYYTLLGDPSLKLGLPDVGPPTGVVATASTGPVPFVDLTWSASATPGAKYDVYRTKQLNMAYTKINDDVGPIETTSFTDDNVVHTQTYYYYVVATDQGFESAWSNFNTECGEPPGDDCVQAKPLNLVPPAVPTGLAVTDAETGGRLDVVWNPNGESDIDTYTVHYGTTSALGLTQTVFGTSTSLTGLQDGIPYYVAIQTTNTSGTQSLISDPPLTATPTLVLGVKAPGLITDLRLAKSGAEGADAVLTWSPVTQDIYGKPVTVSHYEVYRGTDPQFLPSIGNRIGMPVGATFTDPGALTGGGPDYFYLVRAVDAEGNPGGLGNQLPDGIRDLRLAPSQGHPSGWFRLSWSAVTTDFDGDPTVISHYEVYAADAPFTRAQIEAGSVDLVVPIVAGTFTDILSFGPKRYYSVLAVDARGNRSPF